MTSTSYSPEIAAKVCAALAEGKGVRTVCKQAGMPSKATVFRWLREYPEFAKMYEIATDERVETMIDEVVEIADNCKTDADSIRKARLRIHARIEAAQRMRPKKYGNRVQLTGEGGGPITHKAVTQMTDDELMAIAGRTATDPDVVPKS